MRIDFTKEPVDLIDSELIVAPFFLDDRPLKGAAGLFDWRMEGFFTNLIREGRIEGRLGESLLTPPRRIAARRIILFGLGRREAFNKERRIEALDIMISKALDLGVNNFHLCVRRLAGEGDDPAEAAKELAAIIEKRGDTFGVRSTATLLVDEKAFGEFVESSAPSLDGS